MKIAVLCATDRGLRALECLFELAPEAEIVVLSSPETPHEPPYVDKIQANCQARECQFFLQTKADEPPARDHLRSGVDLLFCFSWRYMVPKEIYDSTRLGSYVVHDSLLPKYRGFSPTVWAMINGEQEVGVTLFEMAEEVDSGPIVGQMAIPVLDEDDIGTIREKNTLATLELLREHYPALASGSATLTVQDEAEATYCCKWTPTDARIRWDAGKRDILNLIRATTSPYTGAYCYLGNDTIRVWKAALPKIERTFVGMVPGAVCGVNDDGSVRVLSRDGEIEIITTSLGEGARASASLHLKSLSTRLL